MLTSDESKLSVLLKFILSANVFPPSVEDLNITSLFPVLFDHHTIYTLSPDVAICAARDLLTGCVCSSIKAAAFCTKAVEKMDNTSDKYTTVMEKTISCIIRLISKFYY